MIPGWFGRFTPIPGPTEPVGQRRSFSRPRSKAQYQLEGGRQASGRGRVRCGSLGCRCHRRVRPARESSAVHAVGKLGHDARRVSSTWGRIRKNEFPKLPLSSLLTVAENRTWNDAFVPSPTWDPRVREIDDARNRTAHERGDFAGLGIQEREPRFGDAIRPIGAFDKGRRDKKFTLLGPAASVNGLTLQEDPL